MADHVGVDGDELRRIEAVCRTVPALSLGELRIQPLTGGITNRNYRIEVDGEACVVRLGGENAGLLGIDRAREYACSVTAARLGIAPKVRAFVLEADALITRFVPGRALEADEASRPKALARVVETLRRFHEGPEVPGNFSAFGTIRRYHVLAGERGVEFPDAMGSALSLLDSIEESLEAGGQPCPCHNDLLPGNLIDDGERIWIIDWEYAAMGDRLFDLGNLAVNLGLDAAGERLLLELYMGEVRSEDLRRLRLMRLVSALRESMWGYLQSAISTLDFDFLEYGRTNLEHFLGAAGDAVPVSSV